MSIYVYIHILYIMYIYVKYIHIYMLITWVNFSVTDFPQSSDEQGSLMKTARRNTVCVGIKQIPNYTGMTCRNRLDKCKQFNGLSVAKDPITNAIILLLDGSEVLQPVQVQRVSNLSSPIRVYYIKISSSSLDL